MRATWTAPDAKLTKKQRRLFDLLIDREVRSFRSLDRIGRELGHSSPTAVYITLEILERKGLVEKAEAPLGWRVRWISRPETVVRQGRRGRVIYHLPRSGSDHPGQSQ